MQIAPNLEHYDAQAFAQKIEHLRRNPYSYSNFRRCLKGVELMYDDISVAEELDHIADNPSRFSKADMSGMMKVAAETIRLQRQRLKEAEAIILDDLVPAGNA